MAKDIKELVWLPELEEIRDAWVNAGGSADEETRVRRAQAFDNAMAVQRADALRAAADRIDAAQTPEDADPMKVRNDPALWLYLQSDEIETRMLLDAHPDVAAKLVAAVQTVEKAIIDAIEHPERAVPRKRRFGFKSTKTQGEHHE